MWGMGEAESPLPAGVGSAWLGILPPDPFMRPAGLLHCGWEEGLAGPGRQEGRPLQGRTPQVQLQPSPTVRKPPRFGAT